MSKKRKPARHGPPPKDVVRLLHRRSQYGYTGKPYMALTDEPESVSARQLKGIVEESQQRFRTARAEELMLREERSLTAQLRETQAQARRQGVDISPELSRIRAHLVQAQKKIKKAA